MAHRIGSTDRASAKARSGSSPALQCLGDEADAPLHVRPLGEAGQPEPLSGSSTLAAVRYRTELGLGVLPVVDKRPRIKGWQNGALRAEASIVKVFDRIPDEAYVGVPTGHSLAGGGYLYVLDVDLDKPGAAEAYAALPALPETVTARTPNGWHYWLRTATPLPGQFREDGLELKGAGQYVVVPPAPGRSWIRDPFEFEIAECPDFLLPPPKIQLARTSLHLRVDSATGEVALDLSNPLSALRQAKPGSRRQTLLRVAGQLAYKSRQGFISDKQARQELFKTALHIGIEASEARRIIEFCFTRNALKVRTDAQSPVGGEAETASNASCHIVSERDRAVLSTICNVYLQRIEESGFPFEQQGSDIFSLRYLASLSGLDHPEKVSRSVERLLNAQLLWRSPNAKRLKVGQRPCAKYRPTYAGMSLAGVHV
jgi:hypothetical protein